jgi:glycerate 2-kinase
VKPTERQLRRDAIGIFRAGLVSVHAGNAVRSHFSLRSGILTVGDRRFRLDDFDRIFLIGAGKAATAMCAAVVDVIGSRLTRGIAVTKHGHTAENIPGVEVVEAGHPIPDESGLAAANSITNLLRELNARDLLIVAVSGGASALLPSPKPPVTLAAKQKTTGLLLRAGADISEINAVRKHLSLLKGGQLASLAYPATVVSLLLSDVIGDVLETIGSGLTAPDKSTFADALGVLQKYSLEKRVPAAVLRHLQLGAEGKIAETPKKGDPILENVHNVVVATNRLALQAAAVKAKRLGYRPMILSSTIGGETREAASVHAQILREAISSGNPVPPPACILSGGETTVTIKGNGKGGRNQEFALAAAIEIAGLGNALVLSVGTDGTDGPTDAAGAVATGDTVKQALAKGLHARSHLNNNDSYPFFDAVDSLVKTGPTGTNVMDLHILLTR